MSAPTIAPPPGFQEVPRGIPVQDNRWQQPHYPSTQVVSNDDYEPSTPLGSILSIVFLAVAAAGFLMAAATVGMHGDWYRDNAWGATANRALVTNTILLTLGSLGCIALIFVERLIMAIRK